MPSRCNISILAVCAMSAMACASAPKPVSGPPAASFTAASPSDGPASTGIETMTYSGEFPCTDCKALRVTLNLRDDGTFRLRCYFADHTNGTDSWYVDLGHWTLTDHRSRLVLYGGYIGTRELAVVDENTLKFLDFDGKELSNNIEKQTITRQRSPSLILEPFRLWGAYEVIEGVAMFIEARTGDQFPIEDRGEAALLQQAVAKNTERCSGWVGVSLLGHFEDRPLRQGGSREVLVVDRFDRLIPDPNCSDSEKKKTQPVADAFAAND